jgi:cytochrome c553
MPHADITLRVPPRALLVLSALLPAAAAAANLASQAATLTADVPHGMVLYLKHCAGCHGRQAWGDGLREIPALAGQRETYLIVQLAHFIDGDRPGSELHGPVMHDTLQPPDLKRAQALRDLGAWLSRAPPNRQPEHGAGQSLAAGKRAYVNACAGCHGVNGEGSDAPIAPVLAAQHYSYLLTQLRSFASGHLAHAPGLVPTIVGPADQQQALSDYASRLAPATSPSEE